MTRKVFSEKIDVLVLDDEYREHMTVVKGLLRVAKQEMKNQLKFDSKFKPEIELL